MAVAKVLRKCRIIGVIETMTARVAVAIVIMMLFLTPRSSVGEVPPGAGRTEFRPLAGRIAKWDAIKALPWRARVKWASLQELNDVINRTPYRTDLPRDEWLAPGEFLVRGGDCEDYAIAKLFEMKARGVEERWLIVAWDTKSARPHAFAMTRTASAWVVLDNQIRSVLAWRDALQVYEPIYAIDVGRDQLYQWLSEAD